MKLQNIDITPDKDNICFCCGSNIEVNDIEIGANGNGRLSIPLCCFCRNELWNILNTRRNTTRIKNDDIKNIKDSIDPKLLCAYCDGSGWKMILRQNETIKVYQKDDEQIVIPLFADLSDYDEALTKAFNTVCQVDNRTKSDLWHICKYIDNIY